MSSSSFITTSNLTGCSLSHSEEQPLTRSELDSRSQTAYTRGRSHESQNDAVSSRLEFSHIEPLQGDGQNRLNRSLGIGKGENVDFSDFRDFYHIDPDHQMACVRQSAMDAYSRLNEESKEMLGLYITEMNGPLDGDKQQLFEDLAVFSFAYNSLPEEARNGYPFSFEKSPIQFSSSAASSSYASSSTPVNQDDRHAGPYDETGFPTVDHVATLASSIDDELLTTMGKPNSIDPNLFIDLRNDLSRYGQGDPKFKKNALATIELLEKFSQLIFQYDQKQIPGGNVCREIKRIASNAGIGLHLDNYSESSSSRSASHKVLIETIRNTIFAVQTCYLDAKTNNLLPVLFIAAFGNGSCFDTRTEVISMYADAINYGYNMDLKNERLLELAVKAYSARMNQNRLPVDFDAFHSYLTQDMGLELGLFQIHNDNPRENAIVKSLTFSGCFIPSINEAFFQAIMDEYLDWPISGKKSLQTQCGDEGYIKESRSAFRKFLKEAENPLLEEINEQNIDRHIDNFIRLNRSCIEGDLGKPIDEAAATLLPKLFHDWKQSGEGSERDRRDKNYTKENRAHFINFLLTNQSISEVGIDKDNVDNYVDDLIREKRSHDKSIEQVLGQAKDEERISRNAKRRSAARERNKKITRFPKVKVDQQSSFSSEASSSPAPGRRERSNGRRRGR